jgi:hypothetical protein
MYTNMTSEIALLFREEAFYGEKNGMEGFSYVGKRKSLIDVFRCVASQYWPRLYVSELLHSLNYSKKLLLSDISCKNTKKSRIRNLYSHTGLTAM